MKILEETYSKFSPRSTILWSAIPDVLGDIGVAGEGDWDLGAVKERACFNHRHSPSLSVLGLVFPQSSRRQLEPMMRNTCFQAALVLRNAAKERAKKKERKKRKEGKKRALVFSASTDNSPIDVL